MLLICYPCCKLLLYSLIFNQFVSHLSQNCNLIYTFVIILFHLPSISHQIIKLLIHCVQFVIHLLPTCRIIHTFVVNCTCLPSNLTKLSHYSPVCDQFVTQLLPKFHNIHHHLINLSFICYQIVTLATHFGLI